MSANELYFTVLGASGAGKTTLLACMNKFFSEVFAGTFSPGDPKTFEILSEAYKLLESEANTSEFEFGSPITNTEEIREYFFNINGRNNRIPVHFYDFPGGWLNSAENNANLKRVSEIVNKSDVVFVIVNAPYLMEYKGKFAERAKINEIQALLAGSLQNLNRDKLILIVPLKCEAYIKDSEALCNKIKELFSDTIELTKNNDKVALAILPVKTVGNAKFSRFDFDDKDEIVSEIFKKQANSKFAPENIDQPLRFAISFFLNHFELPQDLRKLRDDIKKGLKIEETQILSGSGLITGESIRTHIPLVDKEMPEEPLVPSVPPVVNKRGSHDYKIAVMGATGVGKTIFLGSYFYLAAIDATAKYTIEPSSQEVARRMKDLSTRLIKDKVIEIGTSERVNFSFSVGTLDNMNVELYDIPGGHTTDMDGWAREKILPDLIRADGALFFISGADLINNPDQTWEDTMVYQKAISLLRQNIDKSYVGRADIPIYFIITKGDTIPNVSINDLEKRTKALIKRASASPEEAGFIEKSFFQKGKNVKIYKTEAMGKWPSSNVIPQDYQPVNVAEPMDDLLRAMYDARHGHKKTHRWLMFIATCIVFGALWTGVYSWDHHNWNKAQDNVKASLRKADYLTAQKILENFKSPTFLSILYPKFLRADSDRNINKGYAMYEEALYSLIQADLATVDESNLPTVTQDFIEAAERFDSYVAVKNFATVAPEHYERVKSKKWYFDIGRLFGFDVSQALKSPDILMKTILQCLETETPETWKSRVNSKIESLIQAWCQAVPYNVTPDVLQSYISAAEGLINNDGLSDRARNELDVYKKTWGNTLEEHYSTIVKQWLSEYRQYTDISKLRSLMNANPDITPKAKKLLTDGINELDRVRIDKIAGSLAKSRSIEELLREARKLGSDANNEIIQSVVNSTIQDLTKEELNKIRETVSGYLRDGRFSDGRKTAMNSINLLRNSLRGGTLEKEYYDVILAGVDNFEKSILSEIHDANLNACRQIFNRNKNATKNNDVALCIDSLNDFVRTWSESSELKNVQRVLDFLNTIQNGVQGTLTVVGGDFSDADRWTDTPDVFVEVHQNNQLILKTKVATDNVRPVFAESTSYTWRMNNAPLSFAAYDENVTSNALLLRQQVNLSGFFGYENLSQVLKKSNGCSLQIKFDANIPSCPWH